MHLKKFSPLFKCYKDTLENIIVEKNEEFIRFIS